MKQTNSFSAGRDGTSSCVGGPCIMPRPPRCVCVCVCACVFACVCACVDPVLCPDRHGVCVCVCVCGPCIMPRPPRCVCVWTLYYAQTAKVCVCMDPVLCPDRQGVCVCVWTLFYAPPTKASVWERPLLQCAKMYIHFTLPSFVCWKRQGVCEDGLRLFFQGDPLS